MKRHDVSNVPIEVVHLKIIQADSGFSRLNTQLSGELGLILQYNSILKTFRMYLMFLLRESIRQRCLRNR